MASSGDIIAEYREALKKLERYRLVFSQLVSTVPDIGPVSGGVAKCERVIVGRNYYFNITFDPIVLTRSREERLSVIAHEFTHAASHRETHDMQWWRYAEMVGEVLGVPVKDSYDWKGLGK